VGGDAPLRPSPLRRPRRRGDHLRRRQHPLRREHRLRHHAPRGRQRPRCRHSVSFAWVTKASFFYGFAVGPGFIEPGARLWLVYASLPWYTAPGVDDSGAQFVFEPAVNTRWGLGEEKAYWLNAGIGGIIPIKGPLGGGNGAGSNIDGFRLHAEFQF
jgi:hypothetical protein